MKKLQKVGYMGFGSVITLILCLTVPAVAASVEKQLTVYYNDIKIYVDGALITPKDPNGNIVDPFVSDGTTYLPVRAVGEALGKTVEWDGTTQSVYIGGKPGAAQYMTDVVPAYQTSSDYYYTEYSALKNGGADKFSMGGVVYTNGITLNARDAWAVYNLNGQYTSLSGVFCHVDGDITGTTDGATWLIYCDGMLAAEWKLTNDMAPQNVSVDLRGVNQLKIQTQTSWSIGKFGLGNPIIK
jgi:hypothetical protein